MATEYAGTGRRSFVVMPFGIKDSANGEKINFDLVYEKLIAPAIADAGIEPFRVDLETRAGSIQTDMLQELLLADLVVADLSIDNPNVFYELGVRHSLRDNATVTIFYNGRGWLPFDVIAERACIYHPVTETADPAVIEEDRRKITETIRATLSAWRGRKVSPIYRLLPYLQEPDWKTLKVGDINEYWQQLDEWQMRIAIARDKQRPGDILLLADEMPNRLLELEALKSAAKALLDLNRVDYALTILERALDLDPDNLWCLQQRGLALGRAKHFEEARTRLAHLAQTHQDGETLGLLGRTHKDHWVRLWRVDGIDAEEKRKRATASAPALLSAVTAYADAFSADPAKFYPGINALTLGHLWRHLTGNTPNIDLDLIEQGVRWTVECALKTCRLERTNDYWELVTRAELGLVTQGSGQGSDQGSEECLDDFRKAASRAVLARDRFALDSTARQLKIFQELAFSTDLVEKALQIFQDGEQRLIELLGPRGTKPGHVILFSGHMIDDPAVRGDGKAKPSRFPAAKVPAAEARIEAALDTLGVRDGDLGICGGACGGDLIFAKACLKRGMRVELRLALREPEFLRRSVTFADDDGSWYRDFRQVKSDARTTLLVMSDELGARHKSGSVFDRANRWQLYSALCHDLDTVDFLALWNGEPGDGPGGTEHMVEQIATVTGRRPIIIDPADL